MEPIQQAFSCRISHRHLIQPLDLSANPQAIFTNNSTYTSTSDLNEVIAEEISGNGYERPTLTIDIVQSTEGIPTATYEQFTLTATGGDIAYDRVALVADGGLVAWYETGPTVIRSGERRHYSLGI